MTSWFSSGHRVQLMNSVKQTSSIHRHSKTLPSVSLLKTNMRKYFLYSEMPQKCPWKQFGKGPWENTFSLLLCWWREKGGREKSWKKKGKKKEKKSCCEHGMGDKDGCRGGWGCGVERVGACPVRNADPFPRWSFWTISFSTEGPENHSAPLLSLPAARLSAGPAPTKHNVSGDCIPPDCIYSHIQSKWEVMERKTTELKWVCSKTAMTVQLPYWLMWSGDAGL